MSPRRPHKIDPKTLSQARGLRRKQTPAEKKLWRKLRNEQIFGLKFRRQFPIGPFITDFCCPGSRVVVEIDGDTHADRPKRDKERTRRLEQAGYRVVRFTNGDVHERLEFVMDAVLKACEGQEKQAPHPDPLPLREGERGRLS